MGPIAVSLSRKGAPNGEASGDGVTLGNGNYRSFLYGDGGFVGSQ